MAKSKLQKRKDNPRSAYWKNKADKLWGAVIHELYQSCAVGIDCTGHVEAHHLIGRRAVVTRHMIENGIGLCTLHHKYCNKLSPHQGPLGFSEWLQDTHPDRWEWYREAKNWIGKADYQEAHSKLVEWCEINAPDLVE